MSGTRTARCSSGPTRTSRRSGCFSTWPAGRPRASTRPSQRGPVNDPNHAHDACFFSEKVESAQLAGFDAVLIANHHSGAGEGAQPEATICGSQGHQFTVTIPGLCVGHRLMHLLFDRTPDYTVPYPSGDPGDVEPDVGAIGNGKIDATSFFSGWGGSRLLNASTLAEIDQFYIDEASDPAFATGSGDVDVHEVATGQGPDADLAYFAHYSGFCSSRPAKSSGWRAGGQ